MREQQNFTFFRICQCVNQNNRKTDSSGYRSELAFDTVRTVPRASFKIRFPNCNFEQTFPLYVQCLLVCLFVHVFVCLLWHEIQPQFDGRQAKSIRHCHCDGKSYFSSNSGFWFESARSRRDGRTEEYVSNTRWLKREHSFSILPIIARIHFFLSLRKTSWKETINISGSLYCDKYCVRFSF